MVFQLVSRTVRVDHHDLDVGLEERQIVVAAVPDDHVGLALRLLQDGAVIDSGVHHRAAAQVRLVLLALLDGALVPVQVLEGREPLHRLLHQVTVRHGVPDGHHPPALVQELPADAARRLALSGAGAHRADRHDRLGRTDRGVVEAQQGEVGAGRDHLRCLVHDVLVRHVGIGEDHQIDRQLANQLLDAVLLVDRDAVGVARPGELGRIAAVGDVGDLGGGEADDLERRIVAEADVEIVEVAAGRTHDQHTSRAHRMSPRKKQRSNRTLDRS